MVKHEKHSKPWILEKAVKGLSVHKYSWSHEKLRKKCRRLCKDGFLVMMDQSKDNFYYKVASQ